MPHKEILLMLAALAVGFFVARKFPNILAGTV